MSLATDTYYSIQVDNLTSSIVSLRHEEQKLSYKVKQDTLTGAASREYLMDVLERELPLSLQENTSMCVAMVDLDYFKQINDNYGHLVGDEVLKGVVGRIKARISKLDIIGRYGGEEFLLIFPKTKIETAIKILERVREHIAASAMNVDELLVSVTVSGGVTCSQKNDTIASLIERADNLMYQAKNKGRNRIES